MRPLGYWLLHVHNGLEQRMDALLASHGLTRRHWQALNTVVAKPRTRAGLAEALVTFRDAAGPSVSAVLDDLVARGWVVDADLIAVTPAGAAGHADAAAAVANYRAQFMAGVSEEDHIAFDRTLERVAANLDSLPD